MSGEPYIDPYRRDLIEEFRRAPVGPHSGDLQRLLNLLRGEPLKGKYVLVCSKPGQEWVLARLSGERSGRVQVLSDQVFCSPADAEWTVFKLRWERLTGRALEI